MDEQQITKKDCLARELARKKDENLRRIAEELLGDIFNLVRIRYKDAFFFFPFDKGNFFFRENIIRMEYPKVIQKKLKRKLSKESTECEEENAQTNNFLEEGDQLIIKIVDKFNEIESTMPDENSEYSKEQAIVLECIKEALNLEGFKVRLTIQGMNISWWGNKD